MPARQLLTFFIPLCFYCAAAAEAQTFTTIYNFKGYPDGISPTGGLVLKNGTFYGTTSLGGAAKYGVVFKLDPSTGTESVVYTFTGGADGAQPYAGLVEADGYLWGTTISGGGRSGSGTVFKVNPTTGAETTVYAFGGPPGDGASAQGKLAYLGGYLFGTTTDGGEFNAGIAFKINVKTGVETVIHNFNRNVDGTGPTSGLTLYKGSFYGVTKGGGPVTSAGLPTKGVVYQLNPATGEITVLHTFSKLSDGAYPFGGIIVRRGKLIGATEDGGPAFTGTIFEVDPVSHIESVLYSFKGGTDGIDPRAPLLAHGGFLYGTTVGGGPYGVGTVFKFDPNTGIETVLYDCSQDAGGLNPYGSILWLNGAIYGVMGGGPGITGYGMVYSLVP